MTRNEYIDLRIENMSIAEMKVMNQWELAGVSAEVYDHFHSKDFMSELSENLHEEIGEEVIESILLEGMEDACEEDLYRFVADKLNIVFY